MADNKEGWTCVVHGGGGEEFVGMIQKRKKSVSR
jgi:hypothetical protein